jgi:hypothetical protein
MPYVLIKTEKSRCPGCMQPVHLLDTAEFASHPAFFICFNCRSVMHVGVGPVQVEKESKELLSDNGVGSSDASSPR